MQGQRLGKFEVGEVIGRGGMAVVYRGLDTALGRPVAIKVMHPHLAHEQESRSRFEREARAVAQLRHPNIIDIYHYSGKDSDETFIVTELVDGPDLKRFVGEHPLSVPAVAAMMVLQVSRALSHAHEHGVIHRDIKPENILIRPDGCLKLTDFGIAHLIDEHLTATGAILGSPAYMSPEHLEGGALDARADVFSLGSLLYTLAAGRQPFVGDSPHALLRQVLDCDPPDPREHNPLIDEGLLAIIRRAMRREVGERFATAAEMGEALERFLRAEGIAEPDEALRLFFRGPESYQEALRASLAERLLGRAREAARSGRRQLALRQYDRVLVLRPADAEVMAEVRALLTRARRRRWVLRSSLAAMVAIGLALALWLLSTVSWFEVTPPAADDGGAPDTLSAPAPGPLVSSGPRRRGAYEFPERAAARGRGDIESELTPRREIGRRQRTRPMPVLLPSPEEEIRVPVVVQVHPPAAEVVVDGVSRGVGSTGPLLLAPGRHVVHIVHRNCPGCAVTTRSFDLDAANPPREPLRFQIGYKPATLSVQGPEGGRVFLDRRFLGGVGQRFQVPMEGLERSGELIVQAAGRPVWKRRVSLKAGEFSLVDAR